MQSLRFVVDVGVGVGFDVSFKISVRGQCQENIIRVLFPTLSRALRL